MLSLLDIVFWIIFIVGLRMLSIGNYPVKNIIFSLLVFTKLTVDLMLSWQILN